MPPIQGVIGHTCFNIVELIKFKDDRKVFSQRKIKANFSLRLETGLKIH